MNVNIRNEFERTQKNHKTPANECIHISLLFIALPNNIIYTLFLQLGWAAHIHNLLSTRLRASSNSAINPKIIADNGSRFSIIALYRLL